MARPQRHNVDYFPHYISDGKKMFVIESKFGNDGYATWFKILEILAKTDDHWLDLNDAGNLMFVAAKCKVDEERLLEIIDSITKLGEFDSDVWKQSKVIWSPKLMESLRDAYVKRSNECMSLESLRVHLKGLRRYKPTKESKVKDTKLNETKEEYPFEMFWSLYAKMTDKAVCQSKWEAIPKKTKALIIDHVPKYVAATPDVQYRKHPSTYLNQKTWEDEALPSVKAKKSNGVITDFSDMDYFNTKGT